MTPLPLFASVASVVVVLAALVGVADTLASKRADDAGHVSLAAGPGADAVQTAPSQAYPPAQPPPVPPAISLPDEGDEVAAMAPAEPEPDANPAAPQTPVLPPVDEVPVTPPAPVFEPPAAPQPPAEPAPLVEEEPFPVTEPSPDEPPEAAPGDVSPVRAEDEQPAPPAGGDGEPARNGETLPEVDETPDEPHTTPGEPAAPLDITPEEPQAPVDVAELTPDAPDEPDTMREPSVPPLGEAPGEAPAMPEEAVTPPANEAFDDPVLPQEPPVPPLEETPGDAPAVSEEAATPPSDEALDEPIPSQEPPGPEEEPAAETRVAILPPQEEGASPGSSDEDAGEGAPEQEPVEDGHVIVQEGNTLWDVAHAIYGSGVYYLVIYEANRGTIDDPDEIFPGQRLVTPGVVGPEVVPAGRQAPIEGLDVRLPPDVTADLEARHRERQRRR